MQTWPGFQLGESLERRHSKPWAILLSIGYLLTIIYEWSTIRFTRGGDGLWIATTAGEQKTWLTVLLLSFFLFSFICAIAFIANLLRERRGFAFAFVHKRVTGTDLLYFVAWLHVVQTIFILLHAFMPYPLFREGSVGSLLESASVHLFILLLAFLWFKGRIGAIGFCKPKRTGWMVVSLLILFALIALALDTVVTNPVAQWLQISLESEREQQIQNEILQAKANDWLAVCAAFLLIGMIVPIAEEILFARRNPNISDQTLGRIGRHSCQQRMVCPGTRGRRPVCSAICDQFGARVSALSFRKLMGVDYSAWFEQSGKRDVLLFLIYAVIVRVVGGKRKMKWFGKQKQEIMIVWDSGSLADAVDQALIDWQNAQRLVDLSEGASEIDDSIYYLQITEKRYMYLLNQAKLEYVGEGA